MVDRPVPVPLFPLRSPRRAGPLAAGSPDAAGPVPLVPLLAPEAEVGPELERFLAPLARDVQAGDLDARDTLYEALAVKIERFVAGAWRLAWAGDGPRRDGIPWDAEDLAQEAFPIFVDLLAAWPGDRPVGPYLLAHFPWRLRNAGRALAAPRRFETAPLPPRVLYLVDDSAAAEEARALLEAHADRLPRPDGQILLWHVRDGRSLGAIARQLGLHRDTVGRRWQAIRDGLKPED